EGTELVDHRVHRALQLLDLAARRDGDLAGQLSVGNGGGDEGDVAHLRGQVAGQRVDAFGQVLPGAGHAKHLRLAAQLSFRAHLPGYAGDLGSERAELVHHRVDGVLQRQHLAAYVDGDLLREVTVGDRPRHLGDVADLVGEVSREDVDVVGQVLPGPAHALYLGLAA